MRLLHLLFFKLISWYLRRFKHSGKEYHVTDVSFSGEDIHKTHEETSGTSLDPRVALIKKFIRHIPELVRAFPEIRGMPKLTNPTSLLLQSLKEQYLLRIDTSEKQLQEALKDINKAGDRNISTNWNAEHVKTFVGSVFDGLIIIAEADVYYRTRILDALILVAQWGESCSDNIGDDWIEKLIVEQNEGTLDMLEAWANKNGRDIKIDGFNKGKINVEAG
tara:strand:+ start:527 stop:1186 length:660 start_codon:yes stop_codon:yes gene_type:complete